MKELCVQEIEGRQQKCYRVSDKALREACRSGGSWEYFDYRVRAERVAPIAPLLPLPSVGSRPTLVLDLDNTLVACRLDYEGTTIAVDSYFVAKRPGVESFLHRMASKFDMVLWTGSRQHYAEAIVQSLPAVFSRVICRRGKRLVELGRDLSRVVMVDDCRTDRVPEEDNLIVMAHYRCDGLHDREGQFDKLAAVLERLAEAADVREDIRQMRRDGSLDEFARCPVQHCGLRGARPMDLDGVRKRMDRDEEHYRHRMKERSKTVIGR